MDNDSFYDVLGVSPNAETEVIEAAYRALRLKYHPDRVGGARAAQRKAQQISAAYDTLSNSEKRRKYDQDRTAGKNLALPHPTGVQTANTPAATRQVETSVLDTKACPHCAENIKKEARVCRYCGLNVAIAHQEPSAPQPQTTIYNNINAHPQPTTTVTETYTVRPRENETAKGCLLAAAILGAFFLIIVALGASADAPETEMGALQEPQPALASADVCTADNERDGQFWAQNGEPWMIVGGQCTRVRGIEDRRLTQTRSLESPNAEEGYEWVGSDDALPQTGPRGTLSKAQESTAAATRAPDPVDDVLAELQAQGAEIYSHDDPANPFVDSQTGSHAKSEQAGRRE
jgi:hypothetical protein